MPFSKFITKLCNFFTSRFASIVASHKKDNAADHTGGCKNDGRPTISYVYDDTSPYGIIHGIPFTIEENRKGIRNMPEPEQKTDLHDKPIDIILASGRRLRNLKLKKENSLQCVLVGEDGFEYIIYHHSIAVVVEREPMNAE